MSKKQSILSVFLILFFSFLFHSIYDKFPNTLTSIFFPVNESIWEHNKMVLLSYITLMIINIAKHHKNPKNFIYSTLISFLICITLNTIVFSLIYFFVLNKNDNLPLTLIIYTISISLSQVVNYYLLNSNLNLKKEKLSLIIIIFIHFLFGYLTYNPLKNPLFYDYSHSHYGIAEK